MASSLEARSPFLDTALLEYVAGLPPSYKATLTRSKRLLKAAAHGLVPHRDHATTQAWFRCAGRLPGSRVNCRDRSRIWSWHRTLDAIRCSIRPRSLPCSARTEQGRRTTDISSGRCLRSNHSSDLAAEPLPTA